MSRVEMSDKASQLLQDLIADHGADDYLLDRLTERLEAIAECPATATEPATLPYPSNRLMANFQEEDATGPVSGGTSA